MQKVSLILKIVKVLAGMVKFNIVYHRKAARMVKEITSDFNLTSVPQLPSIARLKMQWYMAEFAYICETMNRLSGQRSSAEQKRTYYLSGALAAISDLIIDDMEMDEARIRQLKHPAEDFKCQNELERLYIQCYHAFLNSLDKSMKYRVIHYGGLIFEAQLRSKQQFRPDISKEETDKICRDKGGYSVLFLRALVSGPISEAEENAWVELGAFIQYCNDAQDIHKDLHRELKTFATVRTGIAEIEEDLGQQMTRAFLLLRGTDYEQKRKDFFLLTFYVMYLGILAKLSAFSRICNQEFSFESFKARSKAEIRASTSAPRLFPFMMARAIKYTYQTSPIPAGEGI